MHFKRDRKSFWYFGSLMFTMTLLLIYYLNFKYGRSQCTAMGNPPDVHCEVRDRDYFFLWSFSAWGVWAALGLVYVWEGIASLFGTEDVKVGREVVEIPRNRSWVYGSWILALAFVPLFANWKAASRAGHTDTFAFAHDLLNSVEPYGVLVTVGDNDTFPLWYAQEVEGIRKDVVVPARRCSTPTGTCGSSFAARSIRTTRRRVRRSIADASGRCRKARRCT